MKGDILDQYFQLGIVRHAKPSSNLGKLVKDVSQSYWVYKQDKIAPDESLFNWIADLWLEHLNSGLSVYSAVQNSIHFSESTEQFSQILCMNLDCNSLKITEFDILEKLKLQGKWKVDIAVSWYMKIACKLQYQFADAKIN